MDLNKKCKKNYGNGSVDQITSGIRSILSVPLIYDTYQKLIGSTARDRRYVQEFIIPFHGAKILDIGCGTCSILEHLPKNILKNPHFKFMTPHEVNTTFEPVAVLDVPNFVSWADEERDLTAWRGNDLQEDALETVYGLEASVKATKNNDLIHTWRTLLTSDHFYYMCTKYSNDGDVHKYFNPYKNPYEAYINFQNILCDFSAEIEKFPHFET